MESINLESTSASISFWKKRWVRIITWSFAIPASLIFIVILIPVVLGLIVRDIPIVHDEDILPTRIDISRAGNAFDDLVILEGLIHDAEGLTTFPFSSTTRAKLHDRAFMEEFLKSNEQALSHFAAAAQRPYFQEPYASDPKLMATDQHLPSFAPWRAVARLQAVKAQYLADTGRSEEALRTAMDGVLIGQLILSSEQPTLITYLVGLAQKRIALETFMWIGASSTLSREQSKKYSGLLEKTKDTSSGLVGAFKVEYQNNKMRFIEVIANKKLREETLGPVFSFAITTNSYYFQPNRTLQLFADNSRRDIAHAEQSCTQKFNEEKDPYDILYNEPWRLYIENNAVGKILDSVGSASLSTVSAKKCGDISQVSAIELLLAINAYKGEHGELPITLDLLTPDYISKIPEDPFDGKPMKYNRAKKIIYSVGTNLIDEHGDTGFSTDWHSMKDQVMPITF